MIKVSTFLHRNELGYTAIPLFGAADSEFEKNASASLLTPVTQYINNLRPMKGSQYVLVNALGASEYFGSNINGDAFPEAGLIHKPAGWSDNPVLDKALAQDWAYGFPTFYCAHAFAHHKNKDPGRAYGEVELAAWNDLMKRVELVVRVDYDKCLQFGGIPVWDKLQAGQFPDVSMGSKVPYDTSSITLDWDTYNKAKETFDPKRHKHPGQAVLDWHRRNPIRGVSVTRADYDQYCLNDMNKIFPDGRKVFVYNDYPRFFDISFVFIGADRTAKVMVYIARNGATQGAVSDKVASATQDDGLYKAASVKGAELKSAEMDKEVLPVPDAVKAIPLMTQNEPSLSGDMIDAMAAVPENKALSTATGLGMVLRPREFQRISLIRMGQRPLADLLDDKNILFPRVEETTPSPMEAGDFLPGLARLLLPLFSQRTALAPAVERRVVITVSAEPNKAEPASSQSTELLRKIGAAYNGYREGLMEMVSNSQPLIKKAATSKEHDLQKVAEAAPEDTFTPLTYCYLRDAFMNEVPFAKT